MKKSIRSIIITLVLIALLALTALTACAKQPEAKITDVYHSHTHLSLQPWSSYDAWVSQSNVVTLYSDGKYVCDISITEGVAKPAEYMTSSLNEIGITLTGTYEKVYDEASDTTTLKLSAADRVLYTGTSSGATIATFGLLDTDDAESAAAFEAEFWGGTDGLKAKIGGAKEIEVNEADKTIVTDIYQYVGPMFPCAW